MFKKTCIDLCKIKCTKNSLLSCYPVRLLLFLQHDSLKKWRLMFKKTCIDFFKITQRTHCFLVILFVFCFSFNMIIFQKWKKVFKERNALPFVHRITPGPPHCFLVIPLVFCFPCNMIIFQNESEYLKKEVP